MLYNRNKIVYFDDSLLDTFVNARGLIKNYPHKAIVGVVTSYVGKPVTWENHEPFGESSMGIEELKILIADGWGIASHSKTHRQLSKLTRQEIIEEIAGSYTWIKEHLGVSPCCFVPPYNVQDSFMISEARKLYPYIRVMTPELRKRTFHSVSKDPAEMIKLTNIMESLGGNDA